MTPQKIRVSEVVKIYVLNFFKLCTCKHLGGCVSTISSKKFWGFSGEHGIILVRGEWGRGRDPLVTRQETTIFKRKRSYSRLILVYAVPEKKKKQV